MTTSALPVQPSAPEADAADEWLTPSWTLAVHATRPPRAMYPLGIDSATQALERRLFAGITSQTPHVVYYAFYAWALTRVRERLWDVPRTRPLTKPEFRKVERRWLARLETVLRAATLERDPEVRGLFGALGARADGPLQRTGRLRLPDQPPYRATGVNFYIGPLMELGYGGRLEGTRGEFVATSGAKVLADGMEAACRAIRGGGEAVTRVFAAADGDTKTVDVADVRTLSSALAIQAVPRTSALHAPLTNLLFAHEGPATAARGTTGWARSQVLAFCLEVANQASGEAPGRPIEVLRRVVLTGYLERSRAYVPSETYRSTLAALRRLYERHLLQLALYGFWREIVVALQPMPITVRPLAQLKAIIAEHVSETARSGEAARWLGTDPLTTPVETLLRRVGRERRRRVRRRPWASGEEELALAVAATRNTSAPTAAASALALLLRVAEEWLSRTQNGRRVARARWHSVGGRERLALDVVCGDLVQRAPLSAGEYLDWLLDTYVIGQSLKATVAKGPQSGTGDYIYFIVPDSGGYRLNQPPSLRNYLAVDSPRLALALGMLEELELVSSRPGFRLTAEGRKLRDRLYRHHRTASADDEA